MDAVRRWAASGLRQFSDDKSSGTLNLAYITPHIIVMGLPASGLRFLNERHGEGGYRVFSFTRSSHYDGDAFASQAHYPFRDHQVPPLEVLGAFCRDAAAFLGSADPGKGPRVVALHCKAGKGRSGLMACALLLFLGVCASVEEALELYAEKRTTDGRGVTIPSQMRWLHYFKQTECGRQPIPAPAAAGALTLQAAGLTGIPLAARAASGSFLLRVTSCRPAESPQQLAAEKVLAELPLGPPPEHEQEQEGGGGSSGEEQSWEAGRGSSKEEAVQVEGSVRLEVLAARAGGAASGAPLLSAWLHTGFVQPGRVILDHSQLDKVAARMGSAECLWLHWKRL